MNYFLKIIPLGNLKIKFHFETRNRRPFLRHFSFHNWRVHFAYLIANELELNSKSAYKIRVFIFAFVSINAFLLLLPHFKTFPEKNHHGLHKV